MGDDFVAGERLGDYEILGVLGAGGMGKVYKVRNVISDRVEAMKVLLANLALQKELADRFLREIKLLASLDHPNIAALRTALTLDNQLVMIMEYVEGVTLASRLQQGPIPAADAVNYTEQLLGALGYAHQLNVIHRDVKPANMMLTPQGVVKLMDFGIARPNNEAGMTVTGATLGSLNYMSPEQVRGEPVDARSDIYSLGVSLYELVTGRLPFRGHSNYSVMSAHLQEVPQPPLVLRPDLPQGLNDIILIAMAKEPQARFQSATAFKNALRNVFPGSGAPSASPATPVPTVAMPGPAPAVSVPALAAASAVRPPSQGGHRGVYMALGGLIVVGILFAAGLYLPRRVKTQASSTPTSAPPDVPAAVAPENPPPAPAPSAPAAPVPVAPPKQAPEENIAAAKKAQQDAAQQAAQQAADAASAAEAQQKAAELADAEKQSDQLISRAAAVEQGLDNLRRAQNAQGYGLRGDMVAAEELMKTDLGRAQEALNQKDPVAAKDYLDKADAQAEKLERFLGR